MPGPNAAAPLSSAWGSAKQPRRVDRRTVPAIGISIRADFHEPTAMAGGSPMGLSHAGSIHSPMPSGRIHSGVLWDVSPMGACVWFPSLHIFEPQASRDEQPGVLHIHHPAQGDDLVMAARLAWIDRQVRAIYIGLEFLEPYDFSNTFLRLLLAAA